MERRLEPTLVGRGFVSTWSLDASNDRGATSDKSGLVVVVVVLVVVGVLLLARGSVRPLELLLLLSTTLDRRGAEAEASDEDGAATRAGVNLLLADGLGGGKGDGGDGDKGDDDDDDDEEEDCACAGACAGTAGAAADVVDKVDGRKWSSRRASGAIVSTSWDEKMVWW